MKKTRLEMIDEFVFEIMENKAKILDDFCKTYIASRLDEKGFKDKIKKLVLVEKRTSDPLVTKYFYEVKRGRTIKEI